MAEQNKESEQEQEQDYLVGVTGLVGRNYGKNNISDRLYIFWVSCHVPLKEDFIGEQLF